MEEKLNLYDFLGYLIPGTAVVLSVYLFLREIQVLAEPISADSLGDSLFVLIIGYFMGHVIQALGHKIERLYLKRWGGWESIKLLDHNNKTYTDEFKNKILNAANEVFSFRVDPQASGDKQEKQKQEIFNLCYSLVTQKGIAPHTPIFHGIYALYRGIVATIFLAGALLVLSAIWPFLFPSASQAPAPPLSFWGSRIVIALALGGGLWLILRRMQDFSKHFANSVYRYFLTWYDTEFDKEAGGAN